jgi:hypothetical protein
MKYHVDIFVLVFHRPLEKTAGAGGYIRVPVPMEGELVGTPSECTLSGAKRTVYLRRVEKAGQRILVVCGKADNPDTTITLHGGAAALALGLSLTATGLALNVKTRKARSVAKDAEALENRQRVRTILQEAGAPVDESKLESMFPTTGGAGQTLWIDQRPSVFHLPEDGVKAAKRIIEGSSGCGGREILNALAKLG